MNPVVRDVHKKMLAEAKLPGSGCSDTYIAHLEDIIAGKADPFEQHEYAAVQLSAYLARQEAKRKAKEAESQNMHRLAACSGHAFKKRPGIFETEWVCSHCEGSISYVQKIWYDAGLAHGKAVK